jgi:lipid II:glycine glycyltransferase (peptidoglycan interpeptide bridge formation enzyme)
MLEVREVNDKKDWEAFVLSGENKDFLHSWNWGEFNKSFNDKIFRFGVYDKNELKALFLVIKVTARRGRFLFIPHGPIVNKSNIKDQNEKLWECIFGYLKDLAVKENCSFVRVSPLMENSKENMEIFKNAGFRDAPIHMMHPEISWILDVSKAEDEILKGMRKTTRNLVRRAEKDGVKVTESKDIKDIDKFYKVHDQTVSRHGFTPFSKNYLLNEFAAFSPDGGISVFFAEYNSEVLSSAVIVFYGDSAFYHHGASLASKVPASYSLMWEIIKEAKKRGCRYLNFWGIAPEGVKNHPWAGLTLFKMGFGGYKEEYLHAQDLIVKPSYWINYMVEKVRRITRNL